MSIQSGSITSKAELVFSHREETGKTVLEKRATGGLFHLSKTYWDKSILLTQLVNPTAGVFNGDEMHLDVKLGEKTSVALISPSASRFYAMKNNGALVTQRFELEEESFLEFRPDYSIPHASSRVQQSNEIFLKKSSRLFYIERFMPGRVAKGEQFAFQRFGSTTKIFVDDVLLVQERMDLDPKAMGWPLLMPDWQVAFSATIWLVAEGVQELKPALEELEKSYSSENLGNLKNQAESEEGQLICGISTLEETIIVVRFLASDSILLKSSIVKLRQLSAQFFKELGDSERVLYSNHT
ncbi:urease accessory protein UreD [Akkermansiaceae bacterium]|nr:urease accessory protein UreD [Akkermansiaceae bacterium]